MPQLSLHCRAPCALVYEPPSYTPLHPMSRKIICALDFELTTRNSSAFCVTVVARDHMSHTCDQQSHIDIIDTFVRDFSEIAWNDTPHVAPRPTAAAPRPLWLTCNSADSLGILALF